MLSDEMDGEGAAFAKRRQLPRRKNQMASRGMDHLDHFCRNTADDGIGRDIFGHYRSCGNDGVFADGH